MSRWTRLLSGCALVGTLLVADAAGAGKLVVAGRDGGYGKALALAIGAYEAANPGVEIEQLALPYGGLYEKLVINLREKAGGIDVVMLDDTWATEFMAKGWLAEMGEADPDFVAPAVAVSRYPYPDGTLFALPFVGNVELFAWRRDLFEKYGLEPPTTWTLARRAAAVIDEREEGVDGVVFRGVKGNPIVTGFLPILWSFGGHIVDAEGNADLMTPESLEALEFWLSLAQYAPEGVETYNASEVRDALQQGRVAMSIELWPSWAPALDDPEVSKVAGLVEIAAAPGEKTGPAPMLGTWLLGVAADAPNAEEAKRFVAFVTSPEMQKRIALEIGIPPTRASVYGDADVVAAYRWYPNQREALMNARPRPRIARWSKVEAILGDYLQLALIGEMAPKDALAEAQARIERALRR